jgi:hypothetical protein
MVQVSKAKGSAKEKKLGGAFPGFFARMLIPEEDKSDWMGREACSSTEIHEWGGKIDRLFSLRIDGQIRDGQISCLKECLN